MINIIISVKGLQKISDRLYIRVCIAKFITILYITKFIITNDRYNRYHADKQQVPDTWRDACKLPKCIKFDAVSYNNY